MFRKSLKFIKSLNHSKFGAMYRCNNVKNFSTLSQAPNEQFRLINRKPIINSHDILVRTLFIKTQETPNPSSLKFIISTKVLEPGHTLDFPNVEAAHCSPLAKMLFNVEGVKRVLLGPDFITIIKKDDNVDWKVLKPDMSSTITNFFASGLPVFTNAKPSGDTRNKHDAIICT